MTTKSTMVRGGHGKSETQHNDNTRWKLLSSQKNGKINIEYVKKKEEKEEIVEKPKWDKEKTNKIII